MLVGVGAAVLVGAGAAVLVGVGAGGVVEGRVDVGAAFGSVAVDVGLGLDGFGFPEGDVGLGVGECCGLCCSWPAQAAQPSTTAATRTEVATAFRMSQPPWR